MWHGGKREMDHFPLFLRGVLEKVVCRMRFFDGKNTVRLAANHGKKTPLFSV
jgi:hypothetical protein